ncbi:FtsK/SpoIIIE domain-containing protein [Saccharopolyspora taberi]|uniref:Cell division protein FtsK n=1 Tax=Saccharopolyspora taberi TaxID=60895 RepID=A0ABN3V4M5_9PSEU
MTIDREHTDMGELIRFPHAHAARAVDIDDTTPDQQTNTAGTEVEVRPDTLPARRERDGVVPPALKARSAAAAKVTARHGYYLLGGAWDTATSVYSRWTGRDIDAQIRDARAAGEHGIAADLMRQRTDNRRILLERIQVWGTFLMRVPMILGGLATLVLALTLIASIVAAFRPGGLSFAQVWDRLFTAVAVGFDWTVWAATVPVPLLLVASAAGVLVSGYNKRRRGQAAPAWAQDAVVRKDEVVNITPSAVVAALRNLGISALRKAIDDAEDGAAWMLGLITRYGPGAQVQVTLPPQVTTTDVQKRRDTLAGNLDRAEHEIQIERDPGSEREFLLWVADSGALDRPVPPSPLLDDEFGPVDIYRDTMPWGVSPKGDPVELNLLQQHFLLAGLSKQGKTAAARALLLWAMLDPSVRVRLADLKGFGDWSMFHDLAEELIEGAGDANFIATCDMLEWGVGEMERRYDKWRDMGRKGDVDRASSQAGSGFEPLILVVDEVQKLYTCTTEHPDGGDIGGKGKKSRAVRAAQAIHDQGRAVNIHLWEFAQNPTDANLPVVVREGAMIRASLFVGTESIAKMALGEAPVDTGAAPHALRSGLDRGTVVLAPGESMDLPGGATHTTVRTHFISTEQSYDIAERAKRFRAGIRHHQHEPEQRDLLDDLAAVFGDDERVKARDLVARLRALAPDHKPYTKLNATTLATQLAEYDVPVKPYDGYPTVRLQHVTTAIAERAVSDQD